ncbi:hypothetical protein C0J52_17115 [Blattella germanica]|nr:hypothetical protein C0J52_17115 [Blattella germanica]
MNSSDKMPDTKERFRTFGKMFFITGNAIFGQGRSWYYILFRRPAIERLIYHTDEFVWEDWPARDEITGSLTMAGLFPRIQKVIRVLVLVIWGPHGVYMVYRGIMDRELLGFNAWFPFDTFSSPTHEISLGNVGALYEIIVVFNGQMMLLAAYCLFGTELSTQAEEVKFAAYSCDWTGCSLSEQKSLMFIMAVASKEFIITAGGVIPVNRETMLAAEEVKFAAYSCDWTGCSLSEQKSLMFIMAVASKEFIITAGGVIPVNRETMLAVCKI